MVTADRGAMALELLLALAAEASATYPDLAEKLESRLRSKAKDGSDQDRADLHAVADLIVGQ